MTRWRTPALQMFNLGQKPSNFCFYIHLTAHLTAHLTVTEKQHLQQELSPKGSTMVIMCKDDKKSHLVGN